jgi:hypothetical protein
MSKGIKDQPSVTIGLDVVDRQSLAVVVDECVEVVGEVKVASTREWVLETRSTPSWQLAAGGRPGRRRRGSPVGWAPWPKPSGSPRGIQVRL